MIKDNLNKRPIPTTPDDLTDPPLFGQPVETTKDVFTLELRKFFNRNDQINRLEELPTIRKFDISFNTNESSQETAVNLIQKYPNIDEDLPLVAVLGATGRNYPISMGIGGSFVSHVIAPPTVAGTLGEPFALANGQTITYKTTSFDGVVHNSTITLRSSRFANIATATAEEVIREINFQSLYASADVKDITVPAPAKVITISYGGPGTPGVKGDIEITGGTAIATLGLSVSQKALYTDSIPYNRYIQSTSMDIAMEVIAEDPNVRTELNDLVWNFFTFQMNDRNYTFLGRSTFDLNIPNETYQLIIKPDPSMSGEQEVARPGDEKDKLFVNRINISVTTMQYIDKAVVKPGTNDPLYLGTVQSDDTIPQKN